TEIPPAHPGGLDDRGAGRDDDRRGRLRHGAQPVDAVRLARPARIHLRQRGAVGAAPARHRAPGRALLDRRERRARGAVRRGRGEAVPSPGALRRGLAPVRPRRRRGRDAMNGASEPASGARRVVAALAAISGVAAVVRLADLGWQSLWVDEYLWTLTASFKS